MSTSSSAPRCRRFAAFSVLAALTAGIQLYSGGAEAKDLYVSPSGSDSISYANNDVSNPWRSLDFAIDNMQGGDTLFLRAGTYTPTSPHYPSISGTQASPTRLTNYPGEVATVDLANINAEWLGLDGVDYWEISNLEFVNVRTVVQIAWTFVSRYHVIRNNRIIANRGGDNVGPIRMHPNAQFTLVDGNDITGGGRKADGVSANTSCMYMDRTSNVQILNNRLRHCVVGIHYKHAPSNMGGSGIEYAYNYITDTDEVLRYNGNNGYIHDNIFGPDSNQGTIGHDNGSPGGNGNTFEHNTFAGGTLGLTSSGPTGAVQNNVVRNNLFLDWSPYIELDIVRWTTAPHNTTLDYNVHPSPDAIREYNVIYTLAQWINRYGGSAHSIEGVPTLQGGTNPVTIDDFRLTSSSVGAGAASDGTDIGARIDLFGSSGMTLVRPNAPQSLVAN